MVRRSETSISVYGLISIRHDASGMTSLASRKHRHEPVNDQNSTIRTTYDSRESGVPAARNINIFILKICRLKMGNFVKFSKWKILVRISGRKILWIFTPAPPPLTDIYRKFIGTSDLVRCRLQRCRVGFEGKKFAKESNSGCLQEFFECSINSRKIHF